MRTTWPSPSARTTAGISDTRTHTAAGARSRAMPGPKRRHDGSSRSSSGARSVFALASRARRPGRRRHHRRAVVVVGRYISREVAGVRPRRRHDPQALDRIEARLAPARRDHCRQDRDVPSGEGRRMLAADVEPPPRISEPCVQRRSQDRPLRWSKPGRRREEAQGPEARPGFSARAGSWPRARPALRSLVSAVRHRALHGAAKG
jgi:hypothetical protein